MNSSAEEVLEEEEEEVDTQKDELVSKANSTAETDTLQAEATAQKVKVKQNAEEYVNDGAADKPTCTTTTTTENTCQLKLATDAAQSSTEPQQQEAEERETTNVDTLTNACDSKAAATDKATTPAPVDEYAEHVTYADDGSAIYTDPKTNHQYKWDTQQNAWMPLEESTAAYENEHYKWCNETQKWLPKVEATENEHYKWDAEKNEWIPKHAQTSAATLATSAQSEPEQQSYSIDEHGQRIRTDKDGVAYFWDKDKNAWFPKIDEDFMARYQMNYGFIDNTSAGEQEKREKEELEEKRKAIELQRMSEEAEAAEANATADKLHNTAAGVKRKAPQDPPKWFEMNPEQNTKVYVSNLPLDITADEFAELMGKCGMIMRDPQTQKFKLKLYTETNGQIKGDGLCDYIKVESVGLALHILDDYELRGHKIHVQPAKFQMRGEYNPALKPKRKKKDKEKLLKMKEKLFDWRPEKMRGERSKNEKVVIIKNLFQPDLFEKEVQLILEYQNDLREECSKCGNVRKVVIYDRHPEGVAQINMATPEEADLVIQMMQGRFFGKRQLTAEAWDGKTKYKIAESETETQQRLSNWDQFLETDDDNKAAPKAAADKNVEVEVASSNVDLVGLEESKNSKTITTESTN